MTKLITYDFENSFPNLSELVKEFISLGQWSFYRLKNDEFLLIIHGGCACCHGGRPTSYFLTDISGTTIREESDKFYQELIADKDNSILEIIRFQLPERITKNYLKIKV